MTVRNYALRLERFASFFGDRRPASVTGQELNVYLETWQQPTTRASHWRTLAGFFTWLFRQRYILRHPFGEGARAPARKPAARLIYTPEEAAEILRLSIERDTAGYWAMALFAGLRDSELKRIHGLADPWAVVDWKDGAIDLRDARLARGPNRRRLILVPCALAWLNWMKERNTPFYPRNSWEKVGRMRARIMAARDFGPEVSVAKNGRQVGDKLVYSMARRSYLSYRLALEEGGPTGSAIVADHVGLTERLLKSDYSGKASKEEAQQFFALFPDNLPVPLGRAPNDEF